MTHKEQTIKKIIEYFKENEAIFNDCIEQLDSYNGYLGDNRYYYMDELDESYSDVKPSELLSRVFYGHDDDTWHTDSYGEKIHGEFNPNRDYFYYNGYGNLVSSDYKDYSHLLDEYAIESMNDHRAYINSIEDDDALTALFDELEEDDKQ